MKKKLNKKCVAFENTVVSYAYASLSAAACGCNCGGDYWQAIYYATVSTH